jgi:hypothetical protein
VSPEIVLDRLRSWAVHEAIAAAAYLLVRNPDNARRAILEGANSPGDSDSIASIAGAMVGVRVGLEQTAARMGRRRREKPRAARACADGGSVCPNLRVGQAGTLVRLGSCGEVTS